MYFVIVPSLNNEPNAFATSSPFQTSVTFLRRGLPAIFSSACRPMNSWSNLTNGPYPRS